MNKRLVSIICAAVVFTQTLPTNAIATTIEDTFIKKGLNSEVDKDKSDFNSEVDKDKSDSNSEESSSDENETSQDNKLKEEELGLDKVKFNAYIDKTDQLLFSIGFDEKEKKFTVSEQSEKNISEETPEETMYTIKIFDKEQKEKFSVELKGKDTGNSEKLELLKSLNYEVGDFIQITPTDSKNVLKITGNIQGDVDKQKEDYSDGIDNYDYIGNVRFQVEEDHLKTVYNEAPVINGLTDIEESENPTNDILTGISIKDDYDGDIDNSKIVPLITELEDGVLDVSYTVEDSWGRKATGKRKISPKKVEQEEVKQEEVKQEEPQIIREEINLRTGSSSNSTSQNTTGLAANEITVEGTPYFNGQHVRFKIRFDTTAKQIQIVDQDGRKLSNTGNNEYFRFVLYDKDMNEKASVSLLGNDKSDSDKLDKIANQLYEEGDFIGVWHAETKIGNGDTNNSENNPSLSSFVPKLKIAGNVGVLKNENGNLVDDTTRSKSYLNGMDKKDISERRFQITSNGLKEVTNEAPKFGKLDDVSISRGAEFDPLKDIKNKITDDFDKFNDDNLDTKAVSITYSSYDVKKVGEQTITYTATDKWGKSSTTTRKLTVTSTNPMDAKYIEFKNGEKSLFKIKFDPVEKKFLVDNLEGVQDTPINSAVSSSIFKLKIYTKGGVLQKTLNIKGTDNLKTVLKKFNGYNYNTTDYIEVWSNTPKNVIIHGVDRDANITKIQQQASSGGNASGEKQDSSDYENYENGIDNTDFMKNVRFEIGETTLKYIYNKAPEFKISDDVNLEFDRNENLTEEQLKEKLITGLTVEDDHDKGEDLIKKVIVGKLDLTTVGEKEVEYRVVDSWGRSSLVKRKVTVYPLNSLEYNYITLRNNETFDPILTIRLNDETKNFVVDKIDRSKIPSSLKDEDKVFELKLIRKKNGNSNTKASEENSVGKDEEVIETITLTKADLMKDEKINEINELSYQYSDYISLWVYDSEDGIFISGKSDVILNGFEPSRSQEAMKNTRFEIKQTGLESIYNEAPKINGLDKKLYVYKNDDITQKIATRDLEVKDDSGEISIDSIEVTDVDGNIVKSEKSESNLKSKFKLKLKSENSNEDNYIETDEIGEFILKYKVTDAWGRSATYQRTVSVISRSVSNDIEFYNKEGNKNLFSLKYNPITNTFDVSKNKNSQPSQEQQQPGESQSPSEQPSQGADRSNGEQVQAKTGDVGQGNETEEVPPQSDGEQSGGTGGSNNQQTNDEIVFKLTVFNVDEQEVGKIELTEEEASNIDKVKEKLKNITIYDNYYIALWSNTPKRIRIQGEVKDNDKLGNEGNETIDYSKGTDNSDYIDNVRFLFTVDGVNAIYNKAPEIIVTSKEMLTSYAGDIIDYTKNIKVIDDRDNEDNDHVIDNSKIKVTIVSKETNSGGTQTDSNGSASGSGSSNTEGNGEADGTDRNPDSESGDSSSSEDIGNQGQTTENEETAFENDESSSKTTDSSENGTSSDKDNSNKTEEEKFLEEQKKHLKIGKNKIKLTVADSWGRKTTIERNLLILNGIDKNEIIFKAGSGKEPIRIKFNHETKNLNITTKNEKFGDGSNPGYVKIAVYRPKKNGDREAVVSEISIDASNRVTNETLQTLKNYTFQYGDYFEIYHGHPNLLSITGGVNDQREDYTDGVQNPENLLNVKFVITESGLKAIYTNPDENNISGNKVVFGPVAQEKFPFKIQIDFENRRFKVTEVTGTNVKYGDNNVVYKIALIRKDSNGTTSIVRQNEFRGNDFGKNIMNTASEGPNYNGQDKNWNGQRFEYNDCLYLWHNESNRSIIKGNIKNEREDYSNGVDDIDNMNNVVFRLTREGLESIYNEAPKIIGANDIDIYQGENFNPSDNVSYSDDHDNGHLTISISPNTINTSELGEKTISYTATDRWGKTTRVERKVTVRPNLYKNVFKVYPQISNEQPATKTGESVDSNSSIEDSNSETTTPSISNSGSVSSENQDSSDANTGENSSSVNKPWQYEENKTKTPAFEIGFDTITNKYKVYNQTNERLSNDKLDETAFAIQIKSADGTEKKKIILTGNDRGTSPKLSELNDLEYVAGDIIRVYRSDLKGIEITGTVTGDIPTNDQMNNDNNKFDYIKNTGFKVSNDGLSAKYNKAPVITGVKKVRTISKGTVDLLDGINASDEIDTDISVNYMYIYVNDELIGTVNQNRNSNENSHREYDFNKVGTYKVKYLLYDKWARTTMIETTVKVESKTRENEIKVYGLNDLDSTNNPSFRITFDTKNNKILLKGPSEESIVDKENSDDDTESENQENNNENSENQDSSLTRTSTENYFEIVVRGSKGEEKANISLNGNTDHDKEQLKNLHELQFDKYDTISLKAKDPKAVKITGNIILENSNENSKVANSYENGFGTIDKYSQVRFKITDDGLREMTKKSLRINGADPITIKRGDTLDLLAGVSVNVNDENNDDYELTVEEITANSKAVTIEADENDTDDSSQSGVTTEDKNKFTKLKEGTYTVKYTATNSWGTTTTVDREITVEPRTDLEKVKLTVKDINNNNVLVIGFDSITRKLRVIEHTNGSINYLDDSQVFEINAFDSLGKTLGTIALRGSQQIDETIINRINAFPYEEGYSLNVWSKELENRINIDGTIKVDNSSKEESKKIRYKRNLSAEQKKDKMENGRFEILSDGLKYIYNEAPKFEGDTSIAIPYYKGNLLKAPDTLKVTDDHDGTISTTEVTVNDDNVDYDKLGIQNITYVVEDSWGRRAEKEGKIEIRSAMDSNSINIYPKENSTTSGSESESTQQPNTPTPEGNAQEESPQTRTTENGNVSGGTNPTPETGDLVTGGTQTPSGSADGSVETVPGGSGSTNNPGEGSNTLGSGSEGTTTPDNENNKENEVVKNSSFSIKFVRDNEDNKNRIQVITGSNAEKEFDSNNPTGTFLTVKIYDANGKVLKSVDILGSDTGKKAKEKIENELNKVNSDSESKDETKGEETEQPQTKTTSDIEDSTESSTNSANGNPQGGGNSSNKNDKQFEYFNGQYIAIEGVTEATMKSVKIQGTVVNKGNDVTYENGVSDIDKIQNVRFKFTDLGLEAVYNNAPTIKIDKDIKLDGTKRNTNSNVEENSSQTTRTSNTEDFDGTKGDDFNYLRGVTISDDHDTLTKDNVEVKWNEKFVGDNTNYENAEETVLEKSSDGEHTLAGNGIKVYGNQKVGENTLYYKVTDSWGRVTFGQRKNIMLKNGIVQNVVRFNTDGKIIMKFEKVEAREQEAEKIKIKFEVSDFDRLTDATHDKYYAIKVTKPNENPITVTLNGNLNKTGVCNALSIINEKEFPYGTKIEIYAGHPQIFSIDGPVRNAAEDYSDKVQNPENLINTIFEITDAGLKATYIPPESDKITANENLISLVAPEKIPLKIKISPGANNTRTSNGGTISIIDSNGTQIDYGVSNVVFKMILKGADGQTKRTININGNVNGNAQSIRDQFRDFNYQYGDTLTISHTTPKKVIIKGNIKGAREDYSDGVDNSLNLTEAVFKLTPTGLEAVYRSAPQIMGMIDIEVEKGKSIDYEQLKQSVTAKDNIDGPITNIQYSAENIDTSKVGMYEFTYTVTNSNQRTTTKSSTITVYDLPTIQKNENATIELNSINNNKDVIEDYLKTAVVASDGDDKLYGKKTKLEVKDNNVNPNKEGKYEATYVATDLYGKTTEKEVDIQVVRTINVTVPTKLPFQVVTNLMPSENQDETTENDGFVSGVLKLKNNNTSPVKVSVASFAKKANSGELEIVDPNYCNWDDMNEQDSMKKMALGLYIKDNSLSESKYNGSSNPLWLSTNKQNSDDTANPDSSGGLQEPSSRTGTTEDANSNEVNVINQELGVLPRRATRDSEPAEASIGFTSKHGKNFIGGSVTGKFELTFKFE